MGELPAWLDIDALARVDVDNDWWRPHRACAEVDPQVFMPRPRTTRAGARYYNYVPAARVCGRCPVQLSCLATWLATEKATWDCGSNVYVGGTKPQERARVRRALRRAKEAA